MKRYLQTRNDRNYDLFDAFDELFRPAFFDENSGLRTNIKESDAEYELDIEIPGYEKDQIKVSLDEGYLTVSCEKKQKEEGNGKRFVRKEISESCARSYYVGTDVAKESIKAKYDKGILTLTVPKAAPKQIQSHFIDIE